ncbi:low molecular weight phosphotyrosine protein phosphatase [Brevibacillus ruminantium]|uniref:protein-tyrosine-phosphatase n=1 Tax=Brevibacillus ruminantium TaxID=2950604 RepID=A0ABY4WJQ8_9BACL|nr:low molecular weight protein-tyrosine-phosphatase [Brevibacillus ruminantium]USG64886.1 low molecular weight phosphotyrosine protein phosphatase [Brevibacillus ruminantium]
MIHVLFVCLGNICRSPMAEAVFRHLVQEEELDSLISIDSAGIGGWHAGNPPHHGTCQVLTEKGISHEGLRARQITPADFSAFDYIVCMDEENLAALTKMAPSGVQVYKLLDFAGHLAERDVEDPYYTGRFDYVYQLVEAGCRGLLEDIKKRKIAS